MDGARLPQVSVIQNSTINSLESQAAEKPPVVILHRPLCEVDTSDSGVIAEAEAIAEKPKSPVARNMAEVVARAPPGPSVTSCNLFDFMGDCNLNHLLNHTKFPAYLHLTLQEKDLHHFPGMHPNCLGLRNILELMIAFNKYYFGSLSWHGSKFDTELLLVMDSHRRDCLIEHYSVDYLSCLNITVLPRNVSYTYLIFIERYSYTMYL